MAGICRLVVLGAGIYVPALLAEWNPLSGTYYEFSPYYGVTPYATLKGTAAARETGFLIHENNGSIGTMVLTLSTPQEADQEKDAPTSPTPDEKTGESDFYFYFSSLGGTVSGFEWSFYLGSFQLDDFTLLKSGLKLGIMSGTYRNQSHQEGKWTTFALAIPFRLKKNFWANQLTGSLDADMNLLSFFKINGTHRVAAADEITFASSPLRLKLQWSPRPRWLLYGGASWSFFEETKISFSTGYFGGIGIRF